MMVQIKYQFPKHFLSLISQQVLKPKSVKSKVARAGSSCSLYTSHLSTIPHTSHLTPHTCPPSPTPHTSHLTPHTSHLTPVHHPPHLTPHTSHLTPHTCPPSPTPHTSHLTPVHHPPHLTPHTCPPSPTPHTSHLTPHTSHLTLVHHPQCTHGTHSPPIIERTPHIQFVVSTKNIISKRYFKYTRTCYHGNLGNKPRVIVLCSIMSTNIHKLQA